VPLASDKKLYQLRVRGVEEDGGSSRVLWFEPPPGALEAFRFEPGQHLTVIRRGTDGEHRRSYSICSRPGQPRLAIGVRHVEAGRVSPWLMGLKEGDVVETLAPGGGFVLGPRLQGRRRFVAIAGGSGVTPLVAMIDQILSTRPDAEVTLVYGNRSPDTAMLMSWIDGLKSRHLGRLAIHLVYEGGGGELDHAGGLDRIDWAGLGRRYGFELASACFLLCGPGAMIEAVRAALVDLAVPPDAILSEYFAPPQISAVPPLGSRAGNLEVRIDGAPLAIDYRSDGGSILDHLLAAGAPAPFSCRTAVCGACRAQLVEGEVSMPRAYALRDDEIAEGAILMCQAYCASPRVKIDLRT